MPTNRLPAFVNDLTLQAECPKAECGNRAHDVLQLLKANCSIDDGILPFLIHAKNGCIRQKYLISNQIEALGSGTPARRAAAWADQ
ncbi:hypothetical protein G2912_21450 [Paraburkholderia aspalathi]|jgi:hypothetical protein|nr:MULTISPECIES: hypothetical protein [Paraburkholderia]MBK3812926.1 hypothetical protein [Paraburkholderia aspalathi]